MNAPNTKVKVTAQDGDFTQWGNHHTKDQLDKVLVTAGLMTKLHHYKESHELSCEYKVTITNTKLVFTETNTSGI